MPWERVARQQARKPLTAAERQARTRASAKASREALAEEIKAR